MTKRGFSAKTIWLLLKHTVTKWQKDKVSLWAAAIAFYTIFSTAPLLIIAIAIAGQGKRILLIKAVRSQ